MNCIEFKRGIKLFRFNNRLQTLFEVKLLNWCILNGEEKIMIEYGKNKIADVVEPIFYLSKEEFVMGKPIRVTAINDYQSPIEYLSSVVDKVIKLDKVEDKENEIYLYQYSDVLKRVIKKAFPISEVFEIECNKHEQYISNIGDKDYKTKEEALKDGLGSIKCVMYCDSDSDDEIETIDDKIMKFNNINKL